MDSGIQLTQIVVLVGMVLTLTFVAALSLRSSKVRERVMLVVGYSLAIAAATYCLDPDDIFPQSSVDDLGAAIFGIAAIVTARDAKWPEGPHPSN